jgi:hypothetical protein
LYESGFSSRGAAEASKQARTKSAFWRRGAHYIFLGDGANYKAKYIIGKITNLFDFFQIHRYIYVLICINHFFNSIFYELAN